MAREALRDAFSSGSDDPYEHVELDVATRLSGAMLLIALLFAAVALLLSPPHGPLGWAGVAGFLAITLATGVIQLKRSTASAPVTLLAGTYAMLVAAGLYRASAGDGAPIEQLIFVIAIYACVIHPLRTSLLVLAAASAVAWTPLWYEPVSSDFATRTTSQLVLVWCFGLLVGAWTARVRRQRADAKAQSALARVDALTGLRNRRALEEAMAPAVSHHRRYNRPLSVLVCDLDDFKGINDSFGHQAGDDLLRKVAQSLTAALRLSDQCYRWGGDEFVAILPEAAFGEASDIATRVRETIALSCRTPDGQPVRITIGDAQLGPGQAGEDLLAQADAALLEGKQRRKARRAAA